MGRYKRIKGNSIMTMIEKIRNSRGRFFGLTTSTQGVINARFLNETPCFIEVYDRNANRYRKIAKNSVLNVNLRGA